MINLKRLYSGKIKYITVPLTVLAAIILIGSLSGNQKTLAPEPTVQGQETAITNLQATPVETVLVATREAVEKQVAGVATSLEPTTPTITTSETVAANSDIKVTRVIDGDTVEIEGGQRVRFIGINTAELGSSKTEPECFALAATQKTKELLEGQMVQLEKDVSETDKYGRLLRYIYKGDTFVNELLVAEGYANVATYPPDVKYKDVFIAAERTARTQNLGLWGACNQVTEATPPLNQTTTPLIQNAPEGSSDFTCNCKRTCTQITSCAEAQYQLKSCGCKQRDSDGDNIACDGAPLHCQN